MKKKTKQKIIHVGQQITKGLWIVFLVGFLFPRRFWLAGLEENIYGQMVAFTSWFFYWVEFMLPVILVGFLVFFQRASLKHIPRITWGILFGLMVVCLVGIGIHPSPHFDALMLMRLVELWIVSYLIVCQLISYRVLLSVLLVSLGVQGVIGIGQLIAQNSLGLSMIGEQNLSPDTLGIAKIDIGAEKYIRPVGTLTHANAWGAMALLAFGLLPFWHASVLGASKQSSLQKIRRHVEKKVWLLPAIIGLSMFFGVCAILSFSRAVWLGLGLVVAIVLLQRKHRVHIFAPLMGILAVLIMWQWELIWQRIAEWQVAIFSRTEMLGYALDMINAKPLGVGVGNFTLILNSDFAQRIFAPWELQPVHNFFLLAGAELGVAAMLILCIGAVALMYKSWKCSPLSLVLVLAMLPSLLTDHFFWTDWSMAMLLVMVFSVREIYWKQKKSAPKTQSA